MIYIIDFGSKKTPYISEAISSLGYESKICRYNEHSIDHTKAKGIILSGAPILLTETTHSGYQSDFAFLKNISIPVLGICFGHQLIGILYETKVFLGKPVKENIEINILTETEILKGLGNKCVMTEDHTEGIELPEEFILLASSQLYFNEAMKHKTKNIWGVQFHPEVSGEPGRTLLNNFCKLCL